MLPERKGKVIPCRWAENRKGAGTNSGESGGRNLEAESIRSRAESTGGCVKLKTATEICSDESPPPPPPRFALRFDCTSSVRIPFKLRDRFNGVLSFWPTAIKRGGAGRGRAG